jgi:integrase
LERHRPGGRPPVVQRSHLWLPGAVGDRPTKTRSVRTVTLDADTVAALTSTWLAVRHLAQYAGLDDERRRAGYVFGFDTDGSSAWRGDTVESRWARTHRSAGTTAVRPHDVRHWQATQLLDAGVPAPTVAAGWGHADGTTTMKIYAHRTVRGDEMAVPGSACCGRSRRTLACRSGTLGAAAPER